MKRILAMSIILLVAISPLFSQKSDFKNFPKEADPLKVGRKLVTHYLSEPYRHFDEIPGYPPYIVYPETCTWFGALKFTQTTKDKGLERKLEERFYPLLGKQKELMQKPNHVDNTVFGIIPLQLYKQTNNEVYYHLGIDFADRQWQMPKSSASDSVKNKKWLDKGLSWQTRIWIDDMYMISAIQTQAFLVSGNREYIDRAAYEMTVYLDSIQQPNGLFYHAKNAPFFWGRGNGWMAVGMAELLENVPSNNKDRPRILQEYKKMMNTLKEFRNTEGLWGQLVDEPEDAWTETSGSAMFTYAMIIGVKNGWLDAKEYAPIARQAWISLMSYINENGDLRNVCIGTNVGTTKQYYLDRRRLVGDLHGQAALLWCATSLL